MRHHKALFDSVQKRTGMYFQQQTYAVVAAFVLGFDEAYEGGLLTGFEEWLAVKIGKGSNLGWPALVLYAAFPEATSPQKEVHANPRCERHAIDTLFQLVADFDVVRSRQGGLAEVFAAHREWMQSEISD